MRYSAGPKLSSSLFFGWTVLWHQYQFALWVNSTYYSLVFINCSLSLFILQLHPDSLLPHPTCTLPSPSAPHRDGVSLLCHSTVDVSPQRSVPRHTSLSPLSGSSERGGSSECFLCCWEDNTYREGEVDTTADGSASRMHFLSHMTDGYFHDIASLY